MQNTQEGIWQLFQWGSCQKSNQSQRDATIIKGLTPEWMLLNIEEFSLKRVDIHAEQQQGVIFG